MVLIVGTILLSWIDNELFETTVKAINSWILNYFGWLFSWSSFLFLGILIIIYFSPFAKKRIGGKNAKPILTRWKWFAISICTTIATGILFWGCAEPLFHYFSPPEELGIASQSADAQQFAMSTMFMHWSFTPYAIYCITGLSFALVYYNHKQPFQISSMLFPLYKKGSSGLKNSMDVICLYSLVLGMSASLGAGILSIMGGLNNSFGLEKSSFMLGVIGLLIVISFVISAISGLQKGIKTLSNINIIFFIFLAIYVLITGPFSDIIQLSGVGLVDYASNFVARSTNIGSALDKPWLDAWSYFYWANWFAWAPIASLFLGKISVGYTVRDYINFNLILPSLFAIIWMTVFSGSTLIFNEMDGNQLHTLMVASGEESVMYAVLEKLPFGEILSMLTLVIIFLSYVTAADSNISAMSSMSALGIGGTEEAPLYIKISWGVTIGLLTFIMLSSSGVNGIRMLSVLGGFPALLIIILVAIGLVKMVVIDKNE